jgi:Domain of Unknown Function (DUF928)
MPWQPFSLVMTIALVFPIVDAIASSGAAAQTPVQTSASRSVTRSRRSPVTIRFNPRPRGAPPATVGLGSRGDCLENRIDPLRVLSPEGESMAAGSTPGVLTTTNPHPSFLVYVPAYDTSAQELSLRLMQVTANDEEIELYQQAFALPSRAGIVELQPTGSSMPEMQVGQQYHWYVSMVCGLMDQSGNPVVEGWIERVVPDSTLLAQLDQATPLDKAALYGQAGIWQDTLMTLVALRRAQPLDSSLQETWNDLLRSVGLGAIANAPLLDCCQPLGPAPNASTPD